MSDLTDARDQSGPFNPSPVRPFVPAIFPRVRTVSTDLGSVALLIDMGQPELAAEMLAKVKADLAELLGALTFASEALVMASEARAAGEVARAEALTGMLAEDVRELAATVRSFGGVL